MEGLAPVDLDFRAIAPLMTLAAGALITLLLDLILPKERSRPWWYVAAIGATVVAFWYVVDLWIELATVPGWTSAGPLGRLSSGHAVFGGAYIVDRFTLIFAAIILIAAFGSILMSAVQREEEMSGYLALILGSALGMVVLAGAGNLITLFLGLEILSLNLYVAVAFKPDDRASKEAGLKYLVLGSAATAVMLYGFAFLYGQTGTLDLAGLAQGWAADNTLFMKVGLGLTLVGLAFKMALAPFHVWAPDVYQGATAPITSLMAVGTKGAAFAALIRMIVALLPADVASGGLTLPLWVLAVLSMVVGSFGAIAQTNIKRLMAYSGVAHAGYLMMALLGMTAAGVRAGVFYLMAYLFMNLGIFSVIAWLRRADREGEDITDFMGLFYRRPLIALSMTIFLLSLAGFPPAGGFIGKLFLILSALDSGAGAAALWLVGGLVATSAVSAYAYLRVMTAMFRRPEGAQAASEADGALAPVAAASLSPATIDGVSPGSSHGHATVSGSWALATVVGIALAGTLYLGLVPGTAFSLADRLLPLM